MFKRQYFARARRQHEGNQGFSEMYMTFEARSWFPLDHKVLTTHVQEACLEHPIFQSTPSSRPVVLQVLCRL